MDLKIEHIDYERVLVPEAKLTPECKRQLKADGWRWFAINNLGFDFRTKAVAPASVWYIRNNKSGKRTNV